MFRFILLTLIFVFLSGPHLPTFFIFQFKFFLSMTGTNRVFIFFFYSFFFFEEGRIDKVFHVA